ncbi:DUF2818 family protein [Limnohabitans sp.]|jgi:hypothetical protein|uniref:DUF2818 family protein n=1 Tax=Limnohabitans sp. TaxID=1907725 RepID=UPI003919FA00
MSQSSQIAALLLLALLAANLPFLNERLALIGPRRAEKPLAWRLLELFLMYLLVGLVGLGLEQYGGQIAAQGWEFYAVTLTMFCTFAFPGFVWRYLLRRR